MPAATRTSGPDADECFRRVAAHGDAAARAALIERYTPLAHRLARRYRHGAGTSEDLQQTAVLGLIKAVDRFDPSRGRAFESFALPTILGELRRYFRDATWDVHVPRQPQEDALVLERFSDRLRAETGRSPTLRAVAETLDWPLERAAEAASAWSAYDAVSLEAPRGAEIGGDQRESLADVIGDVDPGYDAAEYAACLRAAAPTFDEREREALRLRFVEDLSQSEIGLRLGISQMQVSRILRRILRRLRAAADETPPPDRADARGSRNGRAVRPSGNGRGNRANTLDFRARAGLS